MLLSAGPRDLLRLVICGSVDDGKSTLLGRLLDDAGLLHVEERERLLTADPNSPDPQYARVLDGLLAEHAQGITIDVAYRSMELAGRRYLVADAPGHQQYTRNMITAATSADAALVLCDVTQGLTAQTRRHLALLAVLEVRHVALLVNKLDLVGYAPEAFHALADGFGELARRLGLADAQSLPVSALHGENLLERGGRLAWFDGPSVAAYLASLPVREQIVGPLRLPVQWVHRLEDGSRALAGRLSGAGLRPGQAVRIHPGNAEARVVRLLAPEADLPEAAPGSSVLVTLDQPVDASRGSVLAGSEEPPTVTDQFQATLIWLGRQPLYAGRRYTLKLGTTRVGASVTDIRHRLDPTDLSATPARELGVHEIGVCNLALDRPVPLDAFRDSRETGSFILIDPFDHDTVAAGMVRHALRRAATLHWQQAVVDRHARAAMKGQQPFVLWFTGLSGAGKSTIANLVEQRLHAKGRHTFLMDGDNLRQGLNRDLGFTPGDRVENIRRSAEVARLMTEAGLIVLTAFISPYRAEREMARELFPADAFLEVFVDAPLSLVEARDPKGLYARARRGELVNFTGLDAPYERPTHPDIHLDTARDSADVAADAVLEELRRRDLI
ncbi:MAG: adenylyl-sulfate kinase [Gammaproteobacteria bacterium]|nr:MAG: adenylyl-sulfate kinase [Gammaproteobacteria bacterium]